MSFMLQLICLFPTDKAEILKRNVSKPIMDTNPA